MPRKWLRQRKLALVRSSLKHLCSALDAVAETVFALDRQRLDDLVDAGRGGVLDRRSIKDVLADPVFVPHVRPEKRRDDSQVRNIPLPPARPHAAGGVHRNDLRRGRPAAHQHAAAADASASVRGGAEDC